MSSKWVWNFGWMARPGPPRAARRRTSAGGSIRPEMPTTVNPIDAEERRDDVQRVSDQWRKSRRNDGNLRFLVRNFSTDKQVASLARPYGAFQNGELIGVVDFAPMFRGHRATGYYADLVRMIPDAPNGTSDLIIATALQDFASGLYPRGIPHSVVGPCPLCQAEPLRKRATVHS